MGGGQSWKTAEEKDREGKAEKMAVDRMQRSGCDEDGSGKNA